MASHIKNLLKQLPFYGKTTKPRIKEFTSVKLLSELKKLPRNYYKNNPFRSSL